ncbi:MAG: UvrD-helicase domain-containing protein [Puniceicoccales bacterium]|jgi:ATP-dependent exoDNAse (exonuclease V) beta subunit|nr:UvrD-helicase domain-containing protein [Puniceicoccales bacterium]
MMDEDLSSRKNFIEDHSSNFSVVAPAGVGKTTAIVKRTAKIVGNPSEKFGQLIVVTYTQKAAAELLERTHREIKTASTAGKFSEKINNVFFGTIHELATKIIRENLLHLGLRSDFQIEQDISSLWNDFSMGTDYLAGLPENTKNHLLAFIKYRDIHSSYIRLGHSPIIGCVRDFPNISFDEVLSFKANSRAKNIVKFQNELKNWLTNDAKCQCKFPELSTKSQDFLEIYESTIMPVFDWAADTYGHILNQIYENFLTYRINLGRLTFDDLIKLANRIIYDEENYNAKMRSKKYSIILDEAQDTDPEQFKLLLGLIDQRWQENNYRTFPATGRFCMVGDPQQSIYSDRTDVSTYLKIHNDLINNGIAHKLTFSITKRFSKNIAENLNNFFPEIFDGKNGQISFVKLGSEKVSQASSPWSKIRVNVINSTKNENPLEPEINAIKSLFSHKIPENFQVSQWSNIAILCPRRSWLTEIKETFSRCNFLPKMQNHSHDTTYADNIIFSWLTAILVCICEPDNTFEFAGVLHEIFTIKDSTAATHFRMEKDENIHGIENALETLRSETYTHSISSVIQEIVLSFYLIDKALTISPNSKDEIFSTLDYVFTAANEADMNNMPMVEFCDTLKKLLGEKQPPEEIDPNAVQLYTFHKAKGLEWEVVILPFLFRGKKQHESPFPRLMKTEFGQKIMMNSIQETKHRDGQKIKLRQNDERLAYVALTRQKSITIFIDDRSIFQNTSGSIADILKLTDETSSSFRLFNNLSEFCHESAEPSKPNTDTNLTIKKYQCNNTNGLSHQDYIAYDKISPSLSDLHSTTIDENIIPKESDEQGITYGLLWHETMNSIPWNGKNFKQFMLKIIDETDNGRLGLEIDRLIHCQPLMQLINSSDLIFTEYSFFLPQGKPTVIDGRIDMLLKSKNNLQIIDWKTDLSPKEIHFRENYFHQMALYGQALDKIFNLTPEKYIYSTYFGKLIKM